jgi:hypothetical protein
MIIPIVRNPNNKFVVARLHYSLDPDKAKPEWVEEIKRGMPESGWRREYEIDYTVFEGKPVFPEFSEINIKPLKAPEKAMMLVGWDFGYHRPAITVSFVNEIDQWCLLKSIIGEDEGILRFGTRIRDFLNSTYSSCKFLHYADPAGHQKNDKSEKTSIEVLNSLDIYPQSKPAPVNEGIEIIRQKIPMRDDGKVGLLVNVTETDLIDGFKGGYSYGEIKEGEVGKEEPVKDGYYIHCFVAGTKVITDKGEQNIEEIHKGDRVLTRKGFKKVKECGETRKDSLVKTYYFSNGATLRGTPDHPIWVKNKGWVLLDSLRYGDIIRVCETLIGQSVNQNKLSLMDKDITAIQIPKRENYKFIIQERVKDFMWRFGNTIMGKFLRDILFTIKTAIHLIIISITWNVLRFLNILQITCLNAYLTQKTLRDYKSIVPELDHLQKNGINLKKERFGISYMVKKCLEIDQKSLKFAPIVAKSIKQRIPTHQNIVAINVKLGRDGTLRKMTKKEIALSAKKNSLLIDIQEQKPVDKKNVFFVSVGKPKKATVYNLSVEDIPEYYANGILVHNCFDSLRYVATNYFEVTGRKPEPNPITHSNQFVTSEGEPDRPDKNIISDEGGLEDFF